MSLTSEGNDPPASSGRGRGVRIVLALTVVVVLLATVGTVSRVLAPDPTGDPCAAMPSAEVNEFFSDDSDGSDGPDGADQAAAVRLTLPGSSTQRCVWLPSSAAGSESSYRRLQVTFGLADSDEYLARMRSRAQSVRDRANGEPADENETTKPRTVEIDESTEELTVFRLATVQPGRTDGNRDIVLELSAYAAPPGPEIGRLRDRVNAMAEDLRPIRESVLRPSPSAGERLPADPRAVDPIARLQSDGLGLAGMSECARVPSAALRHVLGEHTRAPTMVGCSWQSDPDEAARSRLGMVDVRIGTADDPVTVRDAYAELSFAADPFGLFTVDRDRASGDELGNDVLSRVVVGTAWRPEAPGGPVGRLAEVVAIRGRTVLTVQYVGVLAGPGGDPEPVESSVAERAALHLARAVLDRP